ncbi:MAG: dihydrolipoyl dehydrogenase family protein, partial [Candidatus Odinarchaeota archaeon]
MTDKVYDLIIIGSGSAGLTAVEFASKIDAEVLLVEADRIGGDCTWTGCVPSKALIHCASTINELRKGKDKGLFFGDLMVTFEGVKNYVHEAITTIAATESPEILRKEGIDVALGKARFISSNEIEVNKAVYSGRKFLIASGAKPYIPLIEGLESVPFLTYETIFDIEQLPDHLIVIGGGPVGCELAQAFLRLGSRVTLIESKNQLLPRDDPEASDLLARVFQREGMNLLFSKNVVKVIKDENSNEIIAFMENGDETRGSHLLVAAGRKPNLEGLGLGSIGIKIDNNRGIVVDKDLKTSLNHIYAAGDCTGGLQFTHLAGYQGFVAARNALLPGNVEGIVKHVPWTTFTDPEVAHVGLSDVKRYDKPSEVLTCSWSLDKVDRAIIDGKTSGFIKIFHKRNGEILGVTIVAPNAGELITEWAIAMNNGIKLGDVAGTIHVYPTYSTGAQQVAYIIRMNEFVRRKTG